MPSGTRATNIFQDILPRAIGNNLLIGGYLQAGYKFSTDDNPNAANEKTGGAKDESEEDTDDALARVKLEASLDLDLGDLSGVGFAALPIRFLPTAKIWYDVVNSEFYHSIGAILRFKLDEKEGTFFDITIQDGAGAPTFNEGSQFGGRLTVRF